jgi:translation initiation factor 1A
MNMRNHFKKKYDKKNKNENAESEEVFRVKLPKKNEVIGVIEQRLGGNKMFVNCLDGKRRNCRVPGRLKRALWLRPDDVVLVEPWELDNERGDIIFKYKPSHIEWLRKNGYLETEKTEF